MSYIVGIVHDEDRRADGRIVGCSEVVASRESFSRAIELAERESAADVSSEWVVIRGADLSNATMDKEIVVLWDSQDDVNIKKFTHFSAEKWDELEKGFSVPANGASVYFDIDGTLGKWYSDMRGYSCIEEILDPANHYFRDIEPYPAMIEYAKGLQESGLDVCIISAADRNTIRDKAEWISKNMPFIPMSNVFFCPLGADKTAFVKGNSKWSVLIDDYNVNLNGWDGRAIKAITPANSHQEKYPEIRLWKELDEITKTDWDYARQAVVPVVQEMAESLDDERAIAIIKKEIEDYPHGYDMYFDYHDIIAPDLMGDIIANYARSVSEGQDEGTLCNAVMDRVYEEYELFFRGEEWTETEFYSHHSTEANELVDNYLDRLGGESLADVLEERGFAGVQFALDDVIGEYKLNVMLGTERERDVDMGSIPDMFLGLEEQKALLEKKTDSTIVKHFDNALTYLIYQQGHTLEEVAEVYYHDAPTSSKFVQSVATELNDLVGCSCASVTLLLKMDRNNLDDIGSMLRGGGNFVVSENVTLGLFDKVNGGGSDLGIELEKPLVIPASMVWNVQVEGERREITRGYTVDQTYGLVGSSWRGDVKSTHQNCIEASATVAANLSDICGYFNSLPTEEQMIKAMKIAGRTYDRLESERDNLRFFTENGTEQFSSWHEVKEWLEGVVFDDPDVSDRVEAALHPEKNKNEQGAR